MAPALAPNSNSTTSPRVERNSTTGGKSVQKYLTKCKSLYSCIYCRTHLANHDELVSRSFQGNHGRAYLFNSVINVSCGPAVQRELMTGWHAVADIFCGNCGTTLGWKYEKAYVETQKYKEGKYIIELAHVVRENRHLELDRSEIFFGGVNSSSGNNGNNNNINSHNNKHNYGRSNDNNGEQQNSLSSSSPNYLPSSSRIDYNDDNEELMFPFYEDLCIDRSSYTSNLSSRLRRIMYLDSTPYDWKHSSGTSASTALSNHNLSQPMNSSSSIGSSSNVSPSTSSSSPSSSELLPSPSERRRATGELKLDTARVEDGDEESDDDDLSDSSSSDRDDRYINDNGDKNRRYRSTTTSEAETQFSFETDGLVIDASSTANINLEILERTNNCDRNQTSNTINDRLSDETNDDDVDGSVEFSDLSAQSDRIHINNPNETNEHNQKAPEQPQPTAGPSFNRADNHSISLDDDEFFDCCTDHDISNSMIVSNSNSMIKSASD